MNNPFVSLAPETMLQSILRGWIFAQTVYVNDNNSSMPEAEKAIVSQNSYGRQLGKIMDALALLVLLHQKSFAAGQDAVEIEAKIKALGDGVFGELLALHGDISKTKNDYINERCARVRGDLAYLQIAEPKNYQALVNEIMKNNSARSVSGTTAGSAGTKTDLASEPVSGKKK